MLLVEGESRSKAQRPRESGGSEGQECSQNWEAGTQMRLRDGLGESLDFPQQI